jgi:hypothetical protein
MSTWQLPFQVDGHLLTMVIEATLSGACAVASRVARARRVACCRAVHGSLTHSVVAQTRGTHPRSPTHVV